MDFHVIKVILPNCKLSRINLQTQLNMIDLLKSTLICEITFGPLKLDKIHRISEDVNIINFKI